MRAQLLAGLRAVVVLTILCGLAFPLFVTLVAQVAFNDKADGSSIKRDGKVVGSSLIGQSFTQPEYFHGRPFRARGSRRPTRATARVRIRTTSRASHRVHRTSGRPTPSSSRPSPTACRRTARRTGSAPTNGAGRRGHRVRIRTRSADLGRERTAASGARRRGARPSVDAVTYADRRPHRASFARVPRREGCERPRAESRAWTR